MEYTQQYSQDDHLLIILNKGCALDVPSMNKSSMKEGTLTRVMVPKPIVMIENITRGPSILTSNVAGIWKATLATV